MLAERGGACYTGVGRGGASEKDRQNTPLYPEKRSFCGAGGNSVHRRMAPRTGHL
ncbi:hypothetical protein HMPREF0262_01544 [Clostridium sp. ATCC 29733]|nr:hypothetical protein HMPREF0262_01544 [Clostridium sp. ATCC 29733]